MLTKTQRLNLLHMEVAKKYPALTKNQIQQILDADQKIQIGDLRSSRQLRISGWGTFRIVDRAARTTRNPQTGQQMQVPARKAITFRAATELQQAVGAGKASRRPPTAATASQTQTAATPRKNGRRRREG